MKLKWFTVSGFASILLGFSVLLAGAQTIDEFGEIHDPPNIMFILDGSGSMWGQIEGVHKKTIAQKALSKIAYGIDKNTFVGMMAYGHRRKGDCGDIETVLELEEGGASKISDITKDLNAVGKTPLSSAVMQASEYMAAQEGESSIVLITDGIETCGIDPCGLAQDLADKGVAIQTYIVGFGLSDEEGQQVACLAEDTGGQYIQAANASELNEALGEIVKITEAPAVEIETIKSDKIQANFRALDKDGNLLDTGVVSWTVTSSEGVERPVSEPLFGFEQTFNFPAGTYTLEARHGTLKTAKTIIITHDEDNVFDVQFIDGTVRLIPKFSANSKPISGVLGWELFTTDERGEQKRVASQPGDIVRFTLPPGDYHGKVSTGKGLTKPFEFTVVTGETTEHDIILNGARLDVKATNVKGVGYIRVFDTDGKQVQSEATFGGHWFLLSEGEYTVEAEFNGTKERADILIQAGENQTITIEFEPQNDE